MTQVVARPQKSTIVRTYTSPPLIRAAFWVLERTAPALGARWAERIWFTLPRPRSRSKPGRGAPPAPGGVAAPAQARPALGARFAITVNRTSVVGEVWGEGPPVYLVHGWAGERTQLGALVDPLVARGRRVVAFDAPSHGESGPGALGPRSSTIPEFVAALTEVVAVYGRPHAVVAHSMGATATAAALCDGLRAERVVMLAPMASPRSYAHQFAAWLGFGERTLRRMIARVERRIGAPMHHFDVPELGRAIAMPATLIVHDRDDATIPVSDGAAIAAAWPTARLRVTSGLGHRRLMRDPAVIAEVVDFVTA